MASLSGYPVGATTGRSDGQLAECTAGLKNLGSTCFINSSLQCLANVPDFLDHFCAHATVEETAPPGEPRISSAFASVLRELWEARKQSVNPRPFKELVGALDDRFSGFEQQDSMEFLEFLIDRLKEDCGPSFGTGKQVLSSSPNVIERLLGGSLRTVTVCPDSNCRFESVVNDPFFSIKLPVTNPRDSGKVPLGVTLVPSVASGGVPFRHCVPVKMIDCTARDVMEALVVKCDVQSPEFCVLAEIRGGCLSFFRPPDILDFSAALPAERRQPRYLLLYEMGNLEALEALFTIESENGVASEESDERRICPDDGKAYTFSELKKAFAGEYSEKDLRDYWRDAMGPVADEVPEGAQCGVVVHIRCFEGYPRRRVLVSVPLVFKADRRATNASLVSTIQTQLQHRFGHISDSQLPPWKLFQASANWDACRAETLLLRSDDCREQPMGLRACEHLVVEFDGEPPAAILLEQDTIFASEEAGKCVDIMSCFQWCTEVEQLDESNALFCNGCKQSVRAFTGFNISSFPPILVIQLKRFEYAHGQRRRLSMPVRFPLEGLDLSKFVSQDVSEVLHLEATKQLPTTLPKYDLLAVSSHFGTAAAGHYVSHVRSARDGRWRLFDDDAVVAVLPEDVASNMMGAYVLFYIRRDHRPECWGTAT